MRIIDHVKRAVLSRLLLQSVTSTAPGEKLDEKLATLTFTHDDLPDRERLLYPENVIHNKFQSSVPPPSSESAAWWDHPGTEQFIRLVSHELISEIDRPPQWRFPPTRSRGHKAHVKSVLFTKRLTYVILAICI